MDSRESNLLPHRPLGSTGRDVTLFGLGGEGILRTNGETSKAVQVIHRALDSGINYFDTAPAYASSRDYYGAALGERRQQVFLASKTHDRSYDGSLRLLDDSLVRLRTDYLDLWQLHDLRTKADLNQIFARDGALRALIQAPPTSSPGRCSIGPARTRSGTRAGHRTKSTGPMRARRQRLPPDWCAAFASPRPCAASRSLGARARIPARTLIISAPAPLHSARRA